MTVAEFKSELETFLQGLRAHQAAWRNAQGWPLSGVKRQALEEQAHRLARHLGRLRPYIYHFIGAPLWVMHVPAVPGTRWNALDARSEEHTSELQSQSNLVCRLLLEKKKKNTQLHALI